MRRTLATAAAAACFWGIGGVHAQTLDLAVGASVTSMDPHYHNLAPNSAAAEQVFEQLVGSDERVRLQPRLATAWRTVAPDTWEFDLREGVSFHNGSPFTAEDVAFTLQRAPNVPNSPSSYGIYTRAVTGVEIVGPHRIRLRTNGPYPLLPNDLSNIFVLDAETHRNATTEDFNNGRATFGTGPFRFTRFAPGDRIEFERNDRYWGGAQPWARVNYRIITNNAARTAALLSGDVALIDNVPTSDAPRLRSDQRVVISEVVGLRLIYLMLDQSRAESTGFVTDAAGQPITPNPMRDARVRRALSMAINRAAVVERVMEGAAIPAGQFLPPGTFSHVPGLEAPRFDADGARRLLAEAGFPNGFRLTLHGPNDRYVNDERIIQAVAQMWSRIGVQTQVQAQPWATFVARAGRQELSAFLVGWGSSTGEASSPLRSLIATFDATRGFGASNRARYSNPAVDQLLIQALGTVDDERREAVLQEATRVAFADEALIPLHIQKNVWAHRRGLIHTARADELTRAMDIRPAP